MVNILLDFDSTTNQLIESQVATLNACCGTHFEYKNCTDWHWLEAQNAHLRDHEGESILDFAWGPRVFKSYEWTLSIPPQPDAYAAMHILNKRHRVYLVSDRAPEMKPWIEEWFAIHEVEPPYEVIVSDRQTMPKWKVARDLNITVAIEDAPHNALDLAGLAWCETFLIDKPWNWKVSHHHIKRVGSLLEAAQEVEVIFG